MDDEHLEEARLDEAIAYATQEAHAHGRSAGDHASCLEMFDDEMLDAVTKHEAAVIEAFGFHGECCTEHIVRPPERLNNSTYS